MYKSVKVLPLFLFSDFCEISLSPTRRGERASERASRGDGEGVSAGAHSHALACGLRFLAWLACWLEGGRGWGRPLFRFRHQCKRGRWRVSRLKGTNDVLQLRSVWPTYRSLLPNLPLLGLTFAIAAATGSCWGLLGTAEACLLLSLSTCETG
ncbi:hypothetical protein FA10DRAFT_197578 [Acaromyces ingoldii]|uniref:Uncharacterized protein n=1 Tax=Acaromyces ingoldii TaxID=215250 RepID=A0A316YGG1_9BASI|nr:hypothetical protein FA10DRAFT_197578 [Acaromyces ingoldii]PWN87183.1 hypothetical protein FA10DRAFT_197578 [Acaromyces ingoldii]